ncbi:MAG TPA: TonB-dependent receptor plug domain-containing protein [Leptospiraceae bacterium]|nr:TonB-dependent receptor plug domain-containing protein [Leptospiraceae bacterium]
MTLSICIYLNMPADIFSQDQKSVQQKLLVINSYLPHRSGKQDSVAGEIQSSLKKELEQHGYEVAVISEPRASGLQTARQMNAAFYAEGYFRSSSNGNLSIFTQIYNPDTGNIIDAVSVSDEAEAVDGLKLDENENKIPKEKTISEHTKKTSIRLRTNSKRSERRENIEESLLQTNLGKDKELSFPVAKENIAKSSEEVFKILAEKEEKVSVASNVVDDAQKQPVSVSVITRQQIKHSGARTLNELLTVYVPGFFTVEDQDDTIAGFRGFAPDNNAKTLLLINGHNLNTEWFWGPPDSVINGMSLDYIERIEVIRGPGSVTLGQGALLGVINIITKKSDTAKGFSGSGMAGANGYQSGTLSGGFEGKEIKDLKAFFQASTAKYNGQELRSEGWARSQPYAGAEGYYDWQRGFWDVDRTNMTASLKKNVATSGSRLKRSNQDVVTSVIQYKGLEFTGFFTNQTRDMYNFYRDRNRLQNDVKHGSVTYTYDWSEKLSAKFKTYYTQDDIFLRSNQGLTLGGTREYRYGGSMIFTLKDIIPNHNIAVGTEFRKYDMGQKNSDGNNFILNYSQNTSDNAILLDSQGKGPNERNRYVYPGSIAVKSIFMEDFYKLNSKWDIFGAFRYDRHPYWGSNLAPRIGTLYAYSNTLRFRLSYQEGFRGVVGASYTGGFEGDGHLRIQNFPYVQPSAIPNSFDANGNPTGYYGDIAKTRPEKMRSHEFAVNWDINSSWKMETIFFYNKAIQIIDVGVLYCDKPSTTMAGPNGCVMPRLGSDIPGNWNGYWFYKNNPGQINQGGLETSITFKSKVFQSTASHSIVRLLSASSGQTDSIYLTSDPTNRQFKGYPSNVFRWNSLYFASEKLTLGLTFLYYPSWYSPRNQRVDGNQLANFSINFRMLENLEMFAVIKNAFGNGNLYPMISNAGGKDISDGTPAVEKRTYWFGLNYTLF